MALPLSSDSINLEISPSEEIQQYHDRKAFRVQPILHQFQHQSDPGPVRRDVSRDLSPTVSLPCTPSDRKAFRVQPKLRIGKKTSLTYVAKAILKLQSAGFNRGEVTVHLGDEPAGTYWFNVPGTKTITAIEHALDEASLMIPGYHKACLTFELQQFPQTDEEQEDIDTQDWERLNPTESTSNLRLVELRLRNAYRNGSRNVTFYYSTCSVGDTDCLEFEEELTEDASSDFLMMFADKGCSELRFQFHGKLFLPQVPQFSAPVSMIQHVQKRAPIIQDCPTPLDDIKSILPFKKRMLLSIKSGTLDQPENLPEFVDPVEVFHCNHLGGIYHNPVHEITLCIPEGAVPDGMDLEINIGVCLHGNFGFPEGLSPVSALVWLFTQQNGGKFRFLKPVELIIPHFIDCQSARDTNRLVNGICFLKAVPQPSADKKIQFLPAGGPMDFTTLATKGILYTQHFCFDCIAAGISHDQIQKEIFCVTCAVPHPITAWSTTYFYFTYYLPTCITNLEELVHREQLCIGEQRRFHISDLLEAKIRSKKQVQCLSSATPVTVTLQPKAISRKELDFWQLHREGQLELMKKTKHYPPNMRLQVGELSPNEEQIITVTFEGTQESEEEMTIELTLPSSSSNVGQASPINNLQVNAQAQAAADPKPIPAGTPTVRQLMVLKTELEEIHILKELACQWKDLGYIIGFDPQGCHVTLIEKDAECEREGPLSCCRRVLMDWMKGRGQYQPPNWTNLIQILEDMNFINLAAKLKNCLC